MAQLDRDRRGRVAALRLIGSAGEARRRPRVGEPDLGLGGAQQPRERGARHPLRPDQRPLLLVGFDDVEVGTHGFALGGLHDLGECALSHILHPRYARPPARQVVRIADDAPELVDRRCDGASATRGGHGAQES